MMVLSYRAVSPEKGVVCLDIYAPDGLPVATAPDVEVDVSPKKGYMLAAAQQADVFRKWTAGEETLVRPYSEAELLSYMMEMLGAGPLESMGEEPPPTEESNVEEVSNSGSAPL